MSTVGGYLDYRGGVQYRGGYHDKCGGYLEYRGGVQDRGDIMSTVRVILSTVGMSSTVGDIMMHMGDIISTVRENLLLFEYPTVLNTPHGTHDIPPHVS